MATVVVATDDETITLTMFDKMIKDIIKQTKSKEQMSVQEMENLLFALPKVEITFDKKQSRVANVFLLN